MQFLIATGNPGKAREFREMLADHKLRWTDLSAHPDAVAVEETGKTFRENACLKAAGYATQFGKWTLADDSGLEVDALVESGTRILHNYGHGGAGITISWGCADEVVSLL